MRVLPVLALAVRAQEAVSLKIEKKDCNGGVSDDGERCKKQNIWMTSPEILGNQFPNNTKISYNYDRALKSTRCYQNVNSVTNLKSPTPQFKSHLIVDYITVA